MTDGGLDAETARKSTAPGDVLVTLANYVVRVVDVSEETFEGVVYGAEDHAEELSTFSWDSVAEYHYRDDIDLETFVEDLYETGEVDELVDVIDPEADRVVDEDGADQDDVEEAVDEVEGGDEA